MFWHLGTPLPLIPPTADDAGPSDPAQRHWRLLLLLWREDAARRHLGGVWWAGRRRWAGRSNRHLGRTGSISFSVSIRGARLWRSFSLRAEGRLKPAAAPASACLERTHVFIIIISIIIIVIIIIIITTVIIIIIAYIIRIFPSRLVTEWRINVAEGWQQQFRPPPPPLPLLLSPPRRPHPVRPAEDR